VLLVDGCSTDGTAEVAREIYPTVRLIAQEGKGKGAALRSGFAAATGDIIVALDADGSTDPAEIPAFVGTLLAGADFVKGSRFLQGGGTADMPLYRRLGNGAFVALANSLFRTHFTDITYGYNAVWRQHQDALALEIDGWAHEIVGNIRAVRNGLRVAEVASFEYCRLAGQAKLRTIPAGWTILKAILAERFRHRGGPSAVWPKVLPDAKPLQLRPEDTATG
jgi:glycosyltransferase involved in cell wall biosynthesis